MRVRLLILPFLLIALFLFAACGDDDDDDGDEGDESSPTATSDEGNGEGATAPELEDGTLSVGSDIAYAPMEFFIEGTEDPDGFDIDLGKAIAEELGVEAEFINTGFDGIIPALQTEEFDIIMSAMTVNPERSEEADFVEYLSVGTGILVPAGNPEGISSIEDLCGLTVAVQVGTIQVDMLDAQNDACDEPIEVVTFDTNPLAVEDVRTGGADANLADFPVAVLDAEESGGELVEILDEQLDVAPYGIALRKESPELKAAIDEALQALQDDGTYDELLEKWGLEPTAIE
jgi:polar amino acid transport system substrate-binding protein